MLFADDDIPESQVANQSRCRARQSPDRCANSDAPPALLLLLVIASVTSLNDNPYRMSRWVKINLKPVVSPPKLVTSAIPGTCAAEMTTQRWSSRSSRWLREVLSSVAINFTNRRSQRVKLRLYHPAWK